MDPLGLLSGDPIAFVNDVWGRRILVHEVDPALLNGVFGISMADHLITETALRTPQVRLAKNGSVLPESQFTRHATIAGQQLTGLIDARKVLAEFNGGAIQYTGGTVLALAADTHPIQREFYDFYRTPRGEFTPKGASARTTTQPTLTSNVKFMNFYPFNDIETISPRPILFITGDQAHSKEFSEDAYKRAAEPKELYVVPGAGHVDLYDRVTLIPFDKLTSFFRKHLVTASA